MRAEKRLPVKLAKDGCTLGVNQSERVHAKSLHHAQAARNGSIGHYPHQRMRRFGHQRNEVPERVVGRRRLRHPVMRLRLHGMHQIRKFHRVLNEKYRHVIAYEVPVALVGIELNREAAHIASGVL